MSNLGNKEIMAKTFAIIWRNTIKPDRKCVML